MPDDIVSHAEGALAPIKTKYVTLVGQQFGRFTVLEVGLRNADRLGEAESFCSCECGVKKRVRNCYLIKGRTKSCGCYQRDRMRSMRKDRLIIKHGETSGGVQSSEYISYRSMIARCECRTHAQYADYGGRGISIFPEWRASFDVFLSYIGRSPGKGFSLDRFPDKNGNYEPGNVRWATATEQNRNRRNNRLVACFGKSLCISEWAHNLGMSRGALSKRLDSGWSPEAALSTPVKESTIA